jgi:glucoamylase
MANSANAGWMIPEQVWDEHPPSGRPGFPRGEGTFSATPLAWSHAQLVRLALSIDAGRPVEQPALVARRYVSR